MRSLLSALLVLSLFIASPAAAPAPAVAADCQNGDAATNGLELIQEGFTVLSRLFVEPVAPSDLLGVALGAVYDEVLGEGTASPDVLAGELAGTPEPGGTWDLFASRYCTLIAGRLETMGPTDLAYPAVEAMADSLDEGHTRFLTPRMYEDHLAWSSGDLRYEGIGARLRGNPLTIDYVFTGSPAEAAGVLLGDRIIAIDGEPAEDMAATDAVMLIRGEAGTPVTLMLARDGGPGLAPGIWELSIVRDSIRVPTIESRMIDEVGYLAIRGFPGPGVYEDVVAELAGFQSAGAQALVVDLRGNSGGRLDVGTRVAALFLPEGTPLYRQTTRRGQAATEATGSPILWAKPVAVLIDAGTASMGEILAAALQEHGTAPLFGTTTAGSVAGSLVVPLSDGSALQVTTLRIDSGKGRVLNRIGVEPDTEVEVAPVDLRSGVDEPLDTAVAYLRSQLRARNRLIPQSMAPWWPAAPAPAFAPLSPAAELAG